jgi:hypothetical protein
VTTGGARDFRSTFLHRLLAQRPSRRFAAWPRSGARFRIHSTSSSGYG